MRASNHSFRLTFAALALVMVFGVSCKKEQAKSAPPPEIKVVEVIVEDVPIYKEYVGQLFGLEDVQINARVEGFLEGIHFKEGSRVKKGQLLYTIDPATFEAEVANRKSQLAEARTLALNAESELDRYEPLAKINAVSQSDYDFTKAKRDASIASVDAAEASLRSSEIKLGYTRIYSPITGFVGKTSARIGEFVGKNPSPVILNTVSRIDVIRVQFFLTEAEYLLLARSFLKRYKKETLTREDIAAKSELTLILSDGSVHPYPGKVDFINREVDASTGAILVQASFPNPNLILRPGQFARVKALIRIEEGAMMVPQRCFTELQGQYSVFVVNAENKIESRQVKIAEKIGSYWIVTEGLSPSDKVVLEGLQKVGPGMEVVPVVTEFENQIDPNN